MATKYVKIGGDIKPMEDKVGPAADAAAKDKEERRLAEAHGGQTSLPDCLLDPGTDVIPSSRSRERSAEAIFPHCDCTTFT